MVLDAFAGALLIAFGLVIIWRSVSEDKDNDLLLHVLFSIMFIIIGLWLILTKIGIALLMVKIAGLVLVILGFFLIVKFPDINEYQRDDMAITAVLLGIVFLIFGGYLLLFY